MTKEKQKTKQELVELTDILMVERDEANRAALDRAVLIKALNSELIRIKLLAFDVLVDNKRGK